MPRRRRGFKALESARRLSGGSGAAGSHLANYIEFRAGNREKNKGTKPEAANRRVTYGLIPFGILLAEGATNLFEMVAITEHSNTLRTTALGLSNTECGYETQAAETFGRDRDFYSAQLIAQHGGMAVGTDRNSGITGKPYKNYGRSTATIPFGQHLTTPALRHERVQFSELANQARTTGQAKSVIHVPEQYKGSQATFPMGG